MANKPVIRGFTSLIIRELQIKATIEEHFTPTRTVAPHSSILAWKIPWTDEPGGLQSMGLQSVGHD